MRCRALHLVDARLLVVVVVTMAMVVCMRVPPTVDDLPTPELAKEDPVDETRHVKGRHDGGGKAHDPEESSVPGRPDEPVEGNATAVSRDLIRNAWADVGRLRLEENFILGEEARRQWEPDDGSPRGDEGHRRGGHELHHAAHVAHVLGLIRPVNARVPRVNDRSRPEEEEVRRGNVCTT